MRLQIFLSVRNVFFAKKILIPFLFLFHFSLFSQVRSGLDRIFDPPYLSYVKGKRVGLITNASAVNGHGEEAFSVFRKNAKKYHYSLVAVFSPEHGFEGLLQATEFVRHEEKGGIPIYSLHGETKRPTAKMLEGIDVLVYDIQSVGSRCYTYETTLFYAMEEAVKRGIEVVVLDRPNPSGGKVVEGPLLEERYRCFLGHNRVPFYHGMTIAEAAVYFNENEGLHCQLQVVPMEGWKRGMTFERTGLIWKAPSPNMPDPATTLVYPATVVLGETLEIVSVDLRGKSPFKKIGAPWIIGEELASRLRQRRLPGILFSSTTFIPSYGKYEGEECRGVFLKVTDPSLFHPLRTQYALFEELQSLYPKEFRIELLKAVKKGRKKACHYIMGKGDFYELIDKGEPITAAMEVSDEASFKQFLEKRSAVLLY